jgi:monofunctional glycosyltransferase
MAKNAPRQSANQQSTPPLTARPSASFLKRCWRWVLKASLYFLGISIGLVIVLKWLPIWFTPTMLDRKIDAIAEGKDSEIHYDWTPYEQISKEMALSVVAAEDQLFPHHFGFDFESMWNAFRNNMKGRRIKGASTITQQVAKNVFLWQGRSYFRKALEAYFTFLIEVIWGKERILEVYLNVAETGPMTFGAEAAAQRYYQKHAAELSRTEAARIAACLPNPNRFLVARPSGYVLKRTNFITRQMRGLGGRTYLADL